MPTVVDVGVEKDHIESLTKANGITAISELIWNSLDADSNNIFIEFSENELGLDSIKVVDDGLGIHYEKAKLVFARLGGSEKKHRSASPSGRQYHGKEGKGRYKALALGNLVKFTSTYKEGDVTRFFSIVIDRNNLSNSHFSDLEELESDAPTGFSVLILNVNNENATQAFNLKNRRELAQKFASYWLNYPTFSIFINGNRLKFESLIKEKDEVDFLTEKGDLTYRFKIRVFEWSFDIRRRMYLCNTKGIPFREINLGIRTSIPISIFVESAYIDALHRDNQIDIQEFDDVLQAALNEAKKFGRAYVRRRMHYFSLEFIKDLKKKNIYPYNGQADSVVEESKRQVFDIVALQINEFCLNLKRKMIVAKD